MANPSHLWDTSAILAHLANEPNAPKLTVFRDKSAIAFISFTELYYLIWQKEGKASADKAVGIVRAWGWPTLWPNERTILIAGRLKASRKLGIADSYIAAIAMEHELALVTKDPDYKVLQEDGLKLIGVFN